MKIDLDKLNPNDPKDRWLLFILMLHIISYLIVEIWVIIIIA